MAAILKRRSLSLGSPSGVVASFLGRLLTTRGDLLRRGASTTERLGLGAANSFLGSNGTDALWFTATDTRTALGFEHGTFTPTVTFATPGDLSVTYGEQTGHYNKIAGGRYLVLVRLNFTPTFTTSSGALRVAGLPSIGNGSWQIGQCENSAGITYLAGRTALLASVVSSQTYCQFTNVGSAVNNSALQAAGVASGGAIFLGFSGLYLGV